MKTFQYSTRDYVPSVDLNTLGKTFDTLEQGHKEAVKAASDLEVTMANLPLNEAENEWRQQKINEIKQTIDNNTIFGNSYAALDDLILKSGNLMADQGMIGRLQAQKDFKDFETRVLNDQSLPQNYKEYFLEKNPYHYEDKYDNKGNLIGGTKWKPNVSPTNVIPLNQLIAQGISIAAKEHGGGTSTRWLDENGRVTTDPMKAFDGEVFNTTTNQWDRLSKEKIWQAVRGLINTTPGAAESLQQDYDVAVWEHDKAVKANGGKPVVSEITGPNGIILSPEEYLFKRVDPAVQAASYYNSTSSTTYGNGLKTYRAALAKVEDAERKKANKYLNLISSSTNTPIKIEVNPGQVFQSKRQNAALRIREMYKQLTGKNLVFSNTTSLGSKDLGNEVITLLRNRSVNNQGIAQIMPYIIDYNDAVNNLHAIYDNLDATGKAKFSFSSRMSAGGQLIPSKDGGTTYDDNMINYINKLYGNKGDKLVINIKDKDMQANLGNILGADNVRRLSKDGITFKTNQIIIPKSKHNYIPLIFDAVNKSYTDASSGVGGTLKDWFVYRHLKFFNIQTYEKIGNNYKEINPLNDNVIPEHWQYTKQNSGKSNPRTNANKNFDNIVSTYKQGTDISNQPNIAPTTITVSNINLTGYHTTNSLLEAYNNGLITEKDYKIQLNNFNNSVKDLIMNHDFSQNNLYVSDGGVLKKINDSEERSNYGRMIKSSYKNNKANFSATFIPSTGNTMIAGYNATITTDDGEQKTFFIQGMLDESAADMMLNEPGLRALNDIEITGGTRTTRSLSNRNSNPELGDISITGIGNDRFVGKYKNKTQSLNKNEATGLALAVSNYNRAKTTILANPSAIQKQALRGTIVESANTIGTLFGLDPNDVFNNMYDDLQSFYDE